MSYCNILPADDVRFRTEISVGFYGRTAKFCSWGRWNRGAQVPAPGFEGIAGHGE